MPNANTLPGCICGCGQIPNTGRSYLPGHNLHKADRPAPTPESAARMSHDVAQKLMEHVTECQLRHIGHCKGPLDTAHLDGNEFNNVRSNLKKLCRSHHRLLDLKVITMRTKTMPSFHVYLSGVKKGVRRYDEARRRERFNRAQRKRLNVPVELLGGQVSAQAGRVSR